jgi:hypothetical protein
VRFGAFAVSCVPVQNGAHKYSKRIASPNQQTGSLGPLSAQSNTRQGQRSARKSASWRVFGQKGNSFSPGPLR